MCVLRAHISKILMLMQVGFRLFVHSWILVKFLGLSFGVGWKRWTHKREINVNTEPLNQPRSLQVVHLGKPMVFFSTTTIILSSLNKEFMKVNYINRSSFCLYPLPFLFFFWIVLLHKSFNKRVFCFFFLIHQFEKKFVKKKNSSGSCS